MDRVMTPAAAPAPPAAFPFAMASLPGVPALDGVRVRLADGPGSGGATGLTDHAEGARGAVVRR